MSDLRYAIRCLFYAGDGTGYRWFRCWPAPHEPGTDVTGAEGGWEWRVDRAFATLMTDVDAAAFALQLEKYEAVEVVDVGPNAALGKPLY